MKRLNQAISLVECLGHFDSIVPSLARILTKQHGVRSGKYSVPLENLWKGHFQDSKFQTVPRYLGPQELVPLVRVTKPRTIHYQPCTQRDH